MDPRYRPQNLHDALIRLMEECGEVIQVCSKALRFGVNDIKPGTDEPNIEAIKREIDDVFIASDDVQRFYVDEYGNSPKRDACKHEFGLGSRCLFCSIRKV